MTKTLLPTLATIMLLGVPGSAVVAQSVPDTGESLLHMGPHDIGFRSEMVVDPSSGRSVHLMIWYPTSDSVADKRVATYPLVIPSVVPSVGLVTLPFSFTAGDFSSFVEERLVYEHVHVAPEPHPVIVHLPGAGTPGFVHIYEGVKFASHGFVFVSVTQPVGTACQLASDSQVVLDTLLAWNATAGSAFHGTIDQASIFGGGHSFGGRTWIASTSAHQECGLPVETRLQGLVLKDATRQTLTVDTMQLNVTPTLLNSQFESAVQLELQQNLGSRPTAVTLEGFTPAPSADNHALFLQACMFYFANQIAGNPDSFVPPSVRANCVQPGFADLEAFFAQQTTKYNIAFLRTLTGQGAFNAVLAPGHATDPGVHVVQWRHPGRP